VDTIRHPRELSTTGEAPQPATAEVPVPGSGASPPADPGAAGAVPSAAHVSPSVPPLVNPPLVALALTVLFLLVLLVAVLLGPDDDRASADEPGNRVPAPVVDAAGLRPSGR
jgi:hypothetical protein